VRESHFLHIVLPFSKFLEEQWRRQIVAFDEGRDTRRSSVGGRQSFSRY